MAQLTIPVGARKLFVGQETTYGTAASTAFARHIEGTLNATLSQTEIEHNAGSARLFQQFVTRQGLKSNDSSVAFGIHAKPAFAKLDSGASPSTPYLGKLLEAILGGSDRGPRRRLVTVNAAAAFQVAGLADSWDEAIARAEESIDSGRAAAVLDALRHFA